MDPAMVAEDGGDIVQELARAGNDLPRDAMRRALEDWENVAPPLLALLEA